MFPWMRRVTFYRRITVTRGGNTGVMLPWVVFCVLCVILTTCATLYRRHHIRDGSSMTSSLPDWVYNGPRDPPPSISGSNVYFWINNTFKGVENFCSEFDNYSSATLEHGGQSWPIYHPGDVKHLKSKLSKFERMMNFTKIKDALSSLDSGRDIGVIDVSYQTSLFGLYAALKDHNVIVINPQLDNILSVWKTLTMNRKTDRTTIFNTSPTEEKSPIPLRKSSVCDIVPLNSFNNTDNSLEILLPGIFLDDVLPFVNFEDVLLVMDGYVNHYEVLRNGYELFHGVNVFGVVIEKLAGVDNEENLENAIGFLESWDLVPYEDPQESGEQPFLYYRS